MHFAENDVSKRMSDIQMTKNSMLHTTLGMSAADYVKQSPPGSPLKSREGSRTDAVALEKGDTVRVLISHWDNRVRQRLKAGDSKNIGIAWSANVYRVVSSRRFNRGNLPYYTLSTLDGSQIISKPDGKTDHFRMNELMRVDVPDDYKPRLSIKDVDKLNHV